MTQNYLSFRVGREWYGIGVAAVVEVFRFMTLSELPAASSAVLGLMTVRDAVMPVVDLRLLFGLTETPLNLDTPVIVLKIEDDMLGLVVDDTDSIEAVAESRFADYEGSDSPFVSGVARPSSRLLLLLDLPKIYNAIRPANSMLTLMKNT